MAVEQVDNNVTDNGSQEAYANELESHNPYDVAALDRYAKKGGTHNIAAVLNLIQHLIDELHNIADSVKKNKAIATEHWTRQTQQASHKTEKASYGQMGKSVGALAGFLPGGVSDQQKAIIKELPGLLGTAYAESKKAEAAEHNHNSQHHQGDKEGYTQATQTMDQSLQSAIEGLRGALNTLGTQNKEAAGR